MIIKKKSILVIIISSALISVVFVMTLIGLFLYFDWMEQNERDQYLKTLYELNAGLFEKYLSFESLIVKIGSSGYFEGKPVVEGTIQNRSNKKILSIKVKLSLVNQDKKVIYVESFYPLWSKTYVPLLSKKTGTYLSPSDSISFKHILGNCPRNVVSYLKEKNLFAKSKGKEDLQLRYRMEEVMIQP